MTEERNSSERPGAEPSDRRIRELLDRVRGLPVSRREALLDRECGDDAELRRRVLARLDAAEGEATSGEVPDEAPAASTPPLRASGAAAGAVGGSGSGRAAPARESAGQRLGRYTLLEPLGEGGFGTVWIAEQHEPVRRRVALKILKLGMDTEQVIARFEAERQALAMMDHPGIAKVFDAGMTETGRPFFVMELVDGVPITEYCDAERLPTRARLDLLGKVCQAIQHAHQKGIIHRDIKPNNVLVTLQDGGPAPKVIDFGIAKAIDQELTERTIRTEQRQIIGTPAYMSPEQSGVSGSDIDTRSDIYSLGVLLYELLAGTRPFTDEELASAGYDGMLRMIREVEPHKPSLRLRALGETATGTAELRGSDAHRLPQILRGDLDWIVMKCLEKDRARRYQTANELAADIQRHLDDEPVLAGPPSMAYRLRKFVRRNRAGVLAAAAVAAAVVIGLAGTTYALLEAKAQSRLAAKRAAELQQVADFQSERLGAIVPELMGARLRDAVVDAAPEDQRATLEAHLARINFTDISLDSLRQNVFDPAIAVIDEQFVDQPSVRAQLLQALARRLGEIGLLEAALPPLERALAIRRDAFGPDHPATLESIASLANALTERGDFAAADAHFQEALEGSRRVLGDDHPDTLNLINDRGVLFRAQGLNDQAEAGYREALAGQRRVLGDDHLDTLTSLGNFGALLMNESRFDEAEEVCREVLAARLRTQGEDHPSTLGAMSNLGVVFHRAGKYDEAEACHRDALSGRRRVLGDRHPQTLNSINNMGALLWARGRYADAQLYFEDALEGHRRIFGNDHHSTLTALRNVASACFTQGKYEEAAPHVQESLDACVRTVGPDHPNTFDSHHLMGVVLRNQGRFDEAEAHFRAALDGRRRVLGPDHSQTLGSISAMGSVHWMQDEYDEAETYYRDALAACRRVLGEDHPDTLASAYDMGVLLRDRGRHDEAEVYLRDALERRRRVLGADHPDTLSTITALAALLNATERAADAELLLGEFLERGEEVFGADGWRLAEAESLLGEALALQERYAAAETLLLEGFAALEASRPDAQRVRALRAAAARNVRLYEAWGHADRAAAWRSRLAPPPDETEDAR